MGIFTEKNVKEGDRFFCLLEVRRVVFTMTIRVEGRHVTIMVEDQVITDYTEPEDVDRGTNVLSSGTFALQGHDPGSKVYYKNIRVRPL